MRSWLATLVLALVIAGCGGDGAPDESPDGALDETPPANAADAGDEEPPARASGDAGNDNADTNDPDRATTAALSDDYRAALAAIALRLDGDLQAIGEEVQAAAGAENALASLERALPQLVAALRTAIGSLREVDAPPAASEDHQRLIAGLESIADLEEELIARVELGDVAGVLARTEAIRAEQSLLAGSLPAEVRTAAGPLLGAAGALGFLPLGVEDLAPATAATPPEADVEAYLARLDFPGATRLLSLDPLIVGEVVLITAQWSVPATVGVGDLLDHYESALRALGAAGESQRLETARDGVIAVGAEHPFGSAIVTLGGATDGSHLVSVTGSFPPAE